MPILLPKHLSKMTIGLYRNSNLSNILSRTLKFSIQDIKDVLKNLNVSKSCGPDLISPRLLKEGADILARPLCILFNRSLEANYFPTTWKFGNVSHQFTKRMKGRYHQTTDQSHY